MEPIKMEKRKLPKLMACMTRGSLENLRNKAMFTLDFLDAKGIRRRKLPLHQCIIIELKECGYIESANYLQDLIYDNKELLAEDDIGIVVDLTKRADYLEHICTALQNAEKEKDKGNTKKESLILLEVAMHYAELGKGILWLAEKFFLASIAVGSQYMLDGGRLKGCCKYHYAKFLLDKFPDQTDTDEPFDILTEVRDESIGKKWPLNEEEGDGHQPTSSETLFCATSIQLHRVLIDKVRRIRKGDVAKAERLSRLAERRAIDAEDTKRIAEAIIEIGISQLQMNSLKNALKNFQRAYEIQIEYNNIEGICEARMHLSAAMQRLGDHEGASKMLNDMGALAMAHNLRRQLGRALHLLGELQLRRERPELGTQYLREAFACFMGFSWQSDTNKVKRIDLENEEEIEPQDNLETIYKMKHLVFEEEAEQSRLMNAISAGQEHMASFFKLIREAGECSVAQTKGIEWKLSNAGWWVKRVHHDFVPCLCPIHNRTPLDVLRFQQELLSAKSQLLESESRIDNLLGRAGTIQDIRKLRSSYHHKSKVDQRA